MSSTIIHSCNGLLLCNVTPTPHSGLTTFESFVIRLESHFRICNPAISNDHCVYLDYPLGDVDSPYDDDIYIFDPLDLKAYLVFEPLKQPLSYKVILFGEMEAPFGHYYSRLNQLKPRIGIRLYSSETSCWSSVVCNLPNDLRVPEGVYCNGAVHWFRLDDDNSVYFDVNRLCFDKLPAVPACVDSNSELLGVKYLGKCKGRLHLILSDSLEFDIWELEEDYSSWVARYRVNLNRIHDGESALRWNLSSNPFCVFFVLRQEEEEEDSMLVLFQDGKIMVSLKSLLERFDSLPLVLLETIVKNCEKAFSEVAAERVLDDMSLKSRGIRFPGRHNESLAPIFTPPRSMSEVELDLPRQTQHDNIPVQSFTPEQTKEAFDVARNSIELLSTVLSSPQQDVLQVYPKAAESLAEPEEYPNLFEDWQVALAVESKAAETRLIEEGEEPLENGDSNHENGEEQYREAHEEHNGEEGSQEEAVVVDANSTDGAILVNGNEAEEEWDEISKGGFSNDCLPSNNSAFWFSKATFERFVRSVSKCCRLKKKSCRLKVHFKQMLCRCPVHLPMRLSLLKFLFIGTAPQANGITGRLTNSTNLFISQHEVQALAKEAAETVVLGH
ncbi:hypothetical protein Ahy_A04g018202 [Arachis hypogaea]|uniref:Uncharacterized protein n=1 Tax=Arachis hypogaea TaxID=3818 RepID=A0A445DD57_ARAHY|nr:hypothetical protein Ahy_A04g018202 [Arachis hypogaea]